jgi:hypothetical protein
MGGAFLLLLYHMTQAEAEATVFARRSLTAAVTGSRRLL